MRLSPRDYETIVFVATFGQVTRKQIRRYIFKANKSSTPCDRQVTKLVKHGLLATVELPTVGGARGGSGQHVYQVGQAGWKLSDTRKAYWMATRVNYHSLAIAETFVDIDEHLKMMRFDAEPDSHEKIAWTNLEPDLYVELDMRDQGILRAWLEVDRATERSKQLKDKMSRYYHAWGEAPEKWRPWPLVVWVVPTAKRRAELESLIKLEPADSRAMYRVCTHDDVVETLLTQ